MSKDRLNNAYQKYLDSFDYGQGTVARKKGGYMGFGKTFDGGGFQDDIYDTGDFGWTGKYVDALRAKLHGAGKWLSNNAKTIGAVGTGVISAINQADLTKDLDSYKQELNATNPSATGVLDNDAVMNWFNTNPYVSDTTAKDFRNKSVLDDAKSAIGAGLSAGAMSANPWVGLGVAAANVVGSVIGRARAKGASDKANALNAEKNKRIDSGLFHAGMQADANNDFLRMLGYYNDPYEYALGGEMRSHGSDWNNGLTFIDAGGRHEDNPYEGVPSGVDDEGVPNLVEEGEVIWNNEYVFSDRIKVPKALRDKYKLKEGLTFAEAITEVTKESQSRPNDPISNETNRAIVNEFMEVQEGIREEKQQRAAAELQSALDEDFMNQLAMYSQSQAQSPEAPIDLGAAQQVPQEGMPAGFRFGGKKFDGGGWKDYFKVSTDKNGNTVYTAPDGMVQYTEAGAKKYFDLNKESWGWTPSKQEQKLPEGVKVVYSKGRNGVRGPVHHYETSDGLNMGLDVNRAIQRQNEINSVSTRQQVQSQIQPVVVPPVQSNTTIQEQTPRGPLVSYAPEVIAPSAVFATRNRRAASLPTVPMASYERTASEEALPAGIKVVYSKGYNGQRGPVHHYETSDGLNMGTNLERAIAHQAEISNAEPSYQEPLNKSELNSQPATVAQPQSIKVEPRRDSTAVKANTAQETVAPSSPVPAKKATENPSTANKSRTSNTTSTVSNSVVPTQGDSGSTKKTASNTVATKAPKAAKPSTGTVAGSSGTIDYNRNINGKAFESQQYYRDFIDYMDNNADSDEAKKWIGYINDEIKKQGNNYVIKSFKDWRRLATDGKVGPVHQATNAIANRYAALNYNGPQDVNLTPFDSNIEYTPEDIALDPIEIPDITTTANNSRQRGDTYDWMGTAPIWGSGIMALNSLLEGPNYYNADRINDAARAAGVPISIPVQTIGDYRTRKPYDERYLVNMANQNRVAATRGIANTSAGNRAMDLLGNMNLAYNNQQNLGEIMRQAYLANRQDDATVAEFNRGTNLQNMQAINQRNIYQAQLNSQRQATALNGLARGYGMREEIWRDWRNDRDANITAFLDNLHQYSRDQFGYNQTRGMIDEGYFNGFDTNRYGNLWFGRRAKGGYKKKRRF